MNRIKKNVMTGLLSALLLSALLLSGCGEGNTGSLPAGAAYRENSPAETAASKEISESPATENASEPSAAEDNLLTVTFLDVGQGNAVLVENDDQYMLIDGGDRDYSSFVVSYLEKQGVTELDYIVSSHYDADHLNGIVGALHVYACKTFLGADYETDTRVYKSLCSVLDEKDIPVVHPNPGDQYALGDAKFTVVCPDSYDAPDANGNSIGIRLEYGDTSFLICGDAGADAEQAMIQSGLTLESDVYLASHHGSRYSSSEAFLKQVNPKAVVISAGLENSYGHPTEEVMERIAETGAQLYRTDLQGTLTVTSDGNRLTWNQEPSGDFRSGEALSGAVSGKGADRGSFGGIDEAGTGDEPDSRETRPKAGTEAGTGADNTADGQAKDASGLSGSGNAKEQAGDYVMNQNTKRFHLPTCSSVDEMKEKNKAEFHGTRQELIDSGYAPCKRCSP